MTLQQTRAPAEPFLLGGRPDHPALLWDGGAMSYGALAAAVADAAADLGPERRVVVVEARNDVDTVVRLLAAFAGHHPVLLLGADDAERHHETVRRYGDLTGDALHPDLALLLSTSGSTGSPKLVRLSRTNVEANARSIASYLGLTADDRAITTLPLHYCYGLSVLTSHLAAGAGVVLTGLSVADECFWRLAERSGATSFAGVPYTFDLLDRTGFAERHLPSLRYVTQAGGRLAPDRVRRLAELGRRRGFDLYVMYGQTEATARMAYLPPALAAARPESIGVPVPGGDFRLEPVADDADDATGAVGEGGVGELVYTGPNVMMGYAREPGDLARGPELTELRTGDLARQGDDGLWEVCGRLDRHAKVFGLRLDLGRLEERLGTRAALVTAGDSLHAFVEGRGVRRAVRDRLTADTGLPPAAVHVHRLDAIPATPRGKPDLAALRRQAEAALTVAGRAEAAPAAGPAARPAVGPAAVRDVYAVLLGRPDASTEDSFVDLGGDSLSFVEASTRLARLLGDLPPGWQHRSPAELAAAARPPRRWVTPVDVPALLRAVAISLILVTHLDLALVPGGAHLLLAVAGYNLARFALAGSRRPRRILAAVAAFAVPSALWIGAVALATGQYHPATALFLNQAVGVDRWTDDWQFWFLESLAWGCLGLAALLAVPAVSRWQRRHRFGSAVAVTLACLALRYAWTGIEAGPTERYTVGLVLWCVALGWAAAEARSQWQRALVAVLAVAGVAGFFGDPGRELLVAAGVVLLLRARPVPLPRGASGVVRVLADASLWIYLTHWQVYPGLEAAGHPWLGLAASVLVGVAAAQCCRVFTRRASGLWRARVGRGPAL